MEFDFLPELPNSNLDERTFDELVDAKLGGLYGKTAKEQLVFPLKHTEVKAKIAGNLSRVEVTQTFENHFSEPLEAVYVFPMPDEAAVDDMEIKIGDRTLKGNIRKRSEAQQIYSQARSQGRTAGLLEQQQDNIFTQSLANIRPGEQIDVTIRYTDSLKFAGGDYEFIFPMVVGSRFIPGTPIDSSGDTDRVPDAQRISPPVMPPGTRSGHEIRVTVEIEAGVPVSDVRSPSHQLQIERGSIVRVKLDEKDTIPNKDLILRYRVAGNETQATVLTQCDQRGGHFAIYLIPALEYRTDEIVPKDVVFLIDTSGSQHGDPLHKSQELMRRFISGLNPDDTFSIIDFANTTKALSPAPLPNTPQNRIRAIDYINQLQANGGTHLLEGIRTVLDFPAALSGRLRSIVLLSDGYIGNENEVLSEIQQRLQPGNRLYSFGVGSSVNRFLLNRIAEIGRGTAQIIRHDEPTEEVAQKFCNQINNPVLTNIQLSWEGTRDSPAIYPSTPPDLFAEQPLVLFGRTPPLTEEDSSSEKKLRITGMTASGKQYEKTLNLIFTQTGHPAIAQLWGRARIKDLMNQMFGCETKAGVEAVTNIALTYQLLSQYTAFVAVSEDVRVEPDGKRQVVEVPCVLPEGVSYKGIFGDAALSIPTSVRSRLHYETPSVYIEEGDIGGGPIEGVSTAVAGFIGFTEDIRGGAELFKPMLVSNWAEYLEYFASPNSSGFTDFNAYLPFAVYGYFLNGGSRCWITSIGTNLPTYSSDKFAQSVEGDRDERTGVRGIFDIDEITMVAFPDLMRAYEAKLLDLAQVHSIMGTMVSLTVTEGTLDGVMLELNNRMVLLDPPPDRVEPQEIMEWLEEFGRRSMFAALYYPWCEVHNPRNTDCPILVPPCGHIMGVWARTDETRGVYTPPVNEVPKGVIRLAYNVNYQEQKPLSSLGINCIRSFPNRGIRVWGARTLVEPDITEWRYINVRRLVSYIAKSIDLGTQWVVFESYDEDLCARVRRTVSNFLERLWREGALVGETPQYAFFVKCDAENNTPETMKLGRLYIDVRVAPVRPAEFVIFRVTQFCFKETD